MDKFAEILQAVGYQAAVLEPLLPMYIHIIASALFPIYTGAHASLSRPASSAKPPKRKKQSGEDESDEDSQLKMEGLSPSDAVILPLFAGTTLAGLYFLIKWLEDPALLNKLLNWYFSIFGGLSSARLLTDIMGTMTSFLFPKTYGSKDKIWQVDSKRRKAKLSLPASEERNSPLPGFLARLPLPTNIMALLWDLRDLPTKKVQVRLYVRKMVNARFGIGLQGFLALILAVVAELYFNLVDKPWWLTNILGFSLAYSTLQIMSPTTAWTGTLILGALFIYDIYFVFFTPLMVTVATKLDIPAKLLFPRPRGPDEDLSKQSLSMLGLGDIVLPGMIIGFALRFDLYLFYLRKQVRRATTDNAARDNADDADTDESVEPDAESDIVKAEWLSATGSWGERFWTPHRGKEVPRAVHGVLFPKTYFYATLIGYVVGMVFTLGIMQVYGHAQPALLYLVPGTVGALWCTALIKGDIKSLWVYSEADEEEEAIVSREGTKNDEKAGKWSLEDWISFLHLGRATKKAEQPKKPSEKEISSKTSNGRPTEPREKNVEEDEDDGRHDKEGNHRDRTSELIFFSINLPQGPSKESDKHAPESQLAKGTSPREKRSNNGYTADLGETY